MFHGHGVAVGVFVVVALIAAGLFYIYKKGYLTGGQG